MAGIQQHDSVWFPIVAVPSAARTANGNLVINGLGWAKQGLFLFDLTNAATLVGDTLDVFVDLSPDEGVTYLNAVHFTQRLGNGADSLKEWAFLNPTHTGTATIDVSTDAAAGAIRQIGLTDPFRVRWVIVGTGTFTFSVKAFLHS